MLKSAGTKTELEKKLIFGRNGKKRKCVQEEHTATREISCRHVRNLGERSPENEQNEDTILIQTDCQIISNEEKPSTNVAERIWAV